MIVAGFGFRADAPRRAFEALLGDIVVTHLAVLTRKADHPEFCAFAAQVGVPVLRVDDVAGIATHSQSARVRDLFHTGSLCEALAIAPLQQARLTQARQVSQDNMVTMAIAEGLA